MVLGSIASRTVFCRQTLGSASGSKEKRFSRQSNNSKLFKSRMIIRRKNRKVRKVRKVRKAISKMKMPIRTKRKVTKRAAVMIIKTSKIRTIKQTKSSLKMM